MSESVLAKWVVAVFQNKHVKCMSESVLAKWVVASTG